MDNLTNTALNALYVELEKVTKASNTYNYRSLYAGGKSNAFYGELLEESMAEISAIEKRIVRMLFRAGAEGIGELLGLIEAGAFPRYTIQATLHRPLADVPRYGKSIYDSLSPVFGKAGFGTSN